MSDQRFVPGTPIDPNALLVVDNLHPEWLRHYPEIAEVVATQPTWEGRAFLVHPVQDQGVGKKLLNMLLATTNDEVSSVKNFPYPIRNEKGTVVAVVVHQTGAYEAYDCLYTYRRAVR